jgi:hypothetical protein
MLLEDHPSSKLPPRTIQACPRFIGIDTQAGSLARCQQVFPGVHWLEGDFTDPNLLGGLGEFDLVLLVNALHGVFSAATIAELGEIDVPLGKQRVAQALSYAAGCLAPAGRLVLFDGLEPVATPLKRCGSASSTCGCAPNSSGLFTNTDHSTLRIAS